MCLRWMPSLKPLKEHVKIYLDTKERAVQKRRKAYARKGLIMARSKTSRKDQKKASLVKRRVKQNMVKDEARGLSIVKEFHFYPRSNGK